MSNNVLCQRLLEIRAARSFSIIADEATDVACDEELSVVTCWVSDEYEIQEDPIGLVHQSKRNSTTATVSGALNGVVVPCKLPLSQCKG